MIPAFKTHFRVERVPPDLVFFLGEGGCRVLQGALLCEISRWIDGRRTLDWIAGRIGSRYSALDVELGVQMLRSEGLVLDATEPLPGGVQALRDVWGVESGAFAARLKRRTFRVVAAGDLDPAPLRQALDQMGLKVTEDGDFVLVLVDDYLQPELEAWNRRSLRTGMCWLPVKPGGAIPWFGPVFRPGHGPCWRCLATRVRQNREVAAFAGGEALRMPPVAGVHPLALQLAALEALRAIQVQGETARLKAFDARTMRLEEHPVMRLPDCPVCGPRKKRPERPRPLLLRGRAKAFLRDGGSRAVAPEVTCEKYRHLISPVTGIIDQIEPDYEDPEGAVFSYVAGHLFVPLTDRTDLLQRGLKQVSAGKGMTPQQARTSALCEALERYSGVFRGNEFCTHRAYRQFRGDAVHPDRILQYSERQYRQRRSSPDGIPFPFDEDAGIDWSPAWSLTEKRFRHVPTALCYYGISNKEKRPFCRADSNGNAAGNSLEEAILQGFLEVVERDSAAIWWYNRAVRPAVDAASFGLPYSDALAAHYRKLGLRIHVLDITCDFRIPAFAALASSAQEISRGFILGMGAHFDARTALSRAVSELNQFLRGYLTGNSRRILQPRGKDLSYLFPDSSQSPRKCSDFETSGCGNLRADVERCVGLAAGRGMETLVLDQTRSDVGLPVVKVIVPGMRPLYPRFAKGRLYDVPVQLGWRARPLREEELNPDRIVV